MQIVGSVQQLGAFMSGRAGRVPGTRELIIPKTPLSSLAIENVRIVILSRLPAHDMQTLLVSTIE